MKIMLLVALITVSCASPLRLGTNPRAELEPLNQRADLILTKAEEHGKKAWGYLAFGFGATCFALSPLAPVGGLAVLAMPIFGMGMGEAGAAKALEEEARIANVESQTASIDNK